MPIVHTVFKPEMYPSTNHEPPFLCMRFPCFAELKDGSSVVILDEDDCQFFFCSELCLNDFLAGRGKRGNDDELD